MSQGLVDIGLFMEPVNTEELEYVRFPGKEVWVVSMRTDDVLAEKEHITKEDLFDKPLILPERKNIRSELASWLGEEISRIRRRYANL